MNVKLRTSLTAQTIAELSTMCAKAALARFPELNPFLLPVLVSRVGFVGKSCP
jgi:hypothetical protein